MAIDNVSRSTGYCAKAHLKEVGLTQNPEIIILQKFTACGLLCLIMWKGSLGQDGKEIEFSSEHIKVCVHTTLEDP